MSELNEGIRIKSWKEWRQGITNAKNRIGAFFSGNPQPTGDVTPEISAAQRRSDNARNNTTNTNTTNTTNNTTTNNKPSTINNKPSTNQTASTPNLADKTGSSKLVNKDGTNVFSGGPSPTAVRSGQVRQQDQELDKQNQQTNNYKSPANIKTNQRQSRALAKNDPRVKLNQFSRTSTYTADDKPGTQVQRSTVFTKHYKTGKELGVMTRNQRRAYDLEAAKFRASNTPQIQTQEYEPDAYDLVLEHLTSTHQVESVKEAHYVMMEMDADIIKAIVDEAIERQAKDRKKLSQPHATPGNRREMGDHNVDTALTDYVPGKGKGRIRKASKKEMRTSAMRDAGMKTNN